MATTIQGRIDWSMERDEEGHRTYLITFRIVGGPDDGPATALTTPGLPLVGSYWQYGGDYDFWAWCRPNASVRPLFKDGEPNTVWLVTFTFSTKSSKFDRGLDAPGSGGSNPSGVEDPLQEPQKVSGSFVKYVEEATNDRFGVPILTSSHEQIRGSQNEWDANRPTIRIEQNWPLLQADIFTPMIDRVNSLPLWGIPARCIKLSNVAWERLYHGQYQQYYKRVFDFDIRADTFDRYLLDEGSKALNGGWNATTGEWEIYNVAPFVSADYTNPSHFIRFTDKNGNPCRVILNGYGRPISGGTGTSSLDLPGQRYVERYDEANFLLLGIPTVI